MKFLILIFVIAVTVVVPTKAFLDHPKQYDVQEAANLFDKFVKTYHRKYKSSVDREKHYDAFKENLANINLKNVVNFPNAYYSIDNFADLTEDEKSKLGRTKIKFYM